MSAGRFDECPENYIQETCFLFPASYKVNRRRNAVRCIFKGSGTDFLFIGNFDENSNSLTSNGNFDTLTEEQLLSRKKVTTL